MLIKPSQSQPQQSANVEPSVPSKATSNAQNVPQPQQQQQATNTESLVLPQAASNAQYAPQQALPVLNITQPQPVASFSTNTISPVQVCLLRCVLNFVHFTCTSILDSI